MLLEFLNLFRSLTYICIALESFFLSYSYYTAGKTPIIKALSKLFLAIGVLFMYMAFLPIVQSLSVPAYLIATQFLIVFALYILIYINDFRKESFNTEQMTTPDEHIKDNWLVLILNKLLDLIVPFKDKKSKKK